MLEARHAIHGEDVDLFSAGKQRALEFAFLTMLPDFLKKLEADREYRGEYRITLQWLSDHEVETEIAKRRSKK